MASGEAKKQGTKKEDPEKHDSEKQKPDSESSEIAKGETASGMTARGITSLAVLICINLLNYMDRFTISGVLPEIQGYFQINDADGGLLQTVFIVFFMIFAPMSGYLGDRFSRKYIMAGGIFVWVVAVLASSFVPATLFWLFLLLRGVVGVGEASYSVIAPAIIADLFTASTRSRALMYFYFAIPIGGGLGYMVGAQTSSLLGGWQWGIRSTPPLGVVCLLLIVFLIREPKRGAAEKARGAKSATNIVVTSYFEDVKSLFVIRTFVTAVFAYTAVVFVVGTLSWWAPTAICRGRAVFLKLNSSEELSDGQRGDISLIFGALTASGGLLGVAFGSVAAMIWSEGKWCCYLCRTPRANALVCGIGSFAAVPLLLIALQLIESNLPLSFVCMFFTIFALSLNWAISVDLMMDVVVPSRRSVGSSWMILLSHLFGDASGPYAVGLVSDAIRGADSSHEACFTALLQAFYITYFMLVLSGVLFFIAGYFYKFDHVMFKREVGYSIDTEEKAVLVKGGVVVTKTESSSEKDGKAKNNDDAAKKEERGKQEEKGKGIEEGKNDDTKKNKEEEKNDGAVKKEEGGKSIEEVKKNDDTKKNEEEGKKEVDGK